VVPKKLAHNTAVFITGVKSFLVYAADNPVFDTLSLVPFVNGKKVLQNVA
jgi:hypothetical protein